MSSDACPSVPEYQAAGPAKNRCAWALRSKLQSERRKIYYSCSNTGGLSWSAKQLLAQENQKQGSGVSSQPSITISADGSLHVSWVDVNPGSSAPDIFYARGENGTWTKPIDVSHSQRIAQQPIIACGRDKKVFLTWVDNSRKETAPVV